MTRATETSATAPVAPAAIAVDRKIQVMLVADRPDEWTPLVAAALGIVYHIAGNAQNTQTAIDSLANGAVDVILLALPFETADGLDFCQRVQGERPTPVILLIEGTAWSPPESPRQFGIVGIVFQNTLDASLLAMIAIGAAWFSDRLRLLQDRDRLAVLNRELLQLLENRKVIERAKGIYMRRYALPEAEAHRQLQLESQKRRLALADLAKKIIESDELLRRE